MPFNYRCMRNIKLLKDWLDCQSLVPDEGFEPSTFTVWG